MQLSLLDLSPIPVGGDRHQAFLNTIDSAQKAEEYGYERIWVAEHHHAAALAGRSPEILIALLAAKTKSIKVGSGSILLNHYSPYKVAENFAALEEMFPGRIDMGIGRATTGPVSDYALQRNRATRQMSDDSNEQISELLHWMNNDFDKQHPFSKLHVYNNGTLPQTWLLGSSAWSASAAAALGLRYSFAAFINPQQAYGITQSYKREFEASHRGTCVQQPELMLSLSIYVGETEEDAARLAAPVQLMMLRMRQNGDTSSLLASEDEAIELMGGLRHPTPLTDPKDPPRVLAGTPKQIKAWLEEIAHTFGSNEIMVQCISASHERRLKSLKMLAEAVT